MKTAIVTFISLFSLFLFASYAMSADVFEESAPQSRSAISSNIVETLKFTAKSLFPETEHLHCEMKFYAVFHQFSTNYCNREFAGDMRNNEIVGLKIRFVDEAGKQILSIPCRVDGLDVLWSMDGDDRVIQLHGSFLYTYGRLAILRDQSASYVYFTDEHGNLLDMNGNPSTRKLGKAERCVLFRDAYASMTSNHLSHSTTAAATTTN